MGLRSPPTFRNSKAPTPQAHLRNLNAIKSLITSLAWWTHNLLEFDRSADEIAQAYTCTQKHMNNVWSEMISCSLWY